MDHQAIELVIVHLIGVNFRLVDCFLGLEKGELVEVQLERNANIGAVFLKTAHRTLKEALEDDREDWRRVVKEELFDSFS